MTVDDEHVHVRQEGLPKSYAALLTFRVTLPVNGGRDVTAPLGVEPILKAST